MSSKPSKQLNPKIKNVWRITDAAWWTGICVFVAVMFGLLSMTKSLAPFAETMFIILGVVWLIGVVAFVAVVPNIRYARWRYEISSDYMEIERGVIWRKHFVIPFIRVQDTDTYQGPLLRMFGLSSVNVYTAASRHVIPGLESHEASELRDRAAELARLAREDV